MLKVTSSPFARAFAAAAILGSFAMASPSIAAPKSAVEAAPLSSHQTTPAATHTGSKKGLSPEERAEKVENRIQTLHEKLAITSEQESAWNDVAQAMRDNEANLSTAIQAKHQNAAASTAVDDLNSYQKIAQAHADGLQKVASAFSSLYDNMSDEQKKNADQVFGQFEGKRGVAKASMKHGSNAAAPSEANSPSEDSAQ